MLYSSIDTYRLVLNSHLNNNVTLCSTQRFPLNSLRSTVVEGWFYSLNKIYDSSICIDMVFY